MKKNLITTVLIVLVYNLHICKEISGQNTENLLDEMQKSGAAIFKVIPEFSFYTVEKNVKVRYSNFVGGKGILFQIYGSDNKLISRSRKNEAVFPVSRLKMGENQLTGKVYSSDGKILQSTTFTVIKLPPLTQGVETKVDYFRRIVLRDGKPFFPFGVYHHSNIRNAAYADRNDTTIKDASYKRIVNAQMNTVVLTIDTSNEKTDWKDVELYVQDAQKYGLMFGHWDIMRTLLQMGRNSKTLDDPEGLEKEKTESQNIFVTSIFPDVEKITACLKNYPNFLFYYGADECNYGNYKLNIYVQKLYYEALKNLDPYHIVFGVYARIIPPVTDALDYFDVLGYDIYTYPDWNTRTSLVCDAMAVEVAKLDARCAEKNKPVWIVPLGNSIDCNRTPRFLTNQQQVCQTYTALIYGAKGLIYFNNDLILSRQTWDTFRNLAKQVKVMESALLNYPVKQDVIYNPGQFIPDKWICPDVHARLFRFPNGDYLLLAVNGRNYPISVCFDIQGLKKAERMFEFSSTVQTKGTAFFEDFDNYGVRAYRLKLSKADTENMRLTVNIKSYPELEKKIPYNETLIKEAANRNNHILNPSFEMERKVDFMPDFYYPYRVVDIDAIGEKGFSWFLDTDNPMFGKYCLCMHRYPLTGGYKNMPAGVYARYALPNIAEDNTLFLSTQRL